MKIAMKNPKTGEIKEGFKGNEMTTKKYLENGWVFAEPDNEPTKMAKLRWGITV